MFSWRPGSGGSCAVLDGHAWDGESPMGRNLDETSGTEAGRYKAPVTSDEN